MTSSKLSQIRKCVQAFLGLLLYVTSFPSKLMLQNASYMFLKNKKSKKNKQLQKKKKISPGGSRTQHF